MGPSREPAALPALTAADFLTLCKAGHGKAPGCDAWACQYLSCLPISFWQCLADLWQTCLAHGLVPTIWTCIRITLIPSSSGGLRPLAISTVLWRVCMTTTLGALRPWLNSWVSAPIFGGMQGKGCNDLHELLHEDIALADITATPLAGRKADVRKCFGSVHPATACESGHG